MTSPECAWPLNAMLGEGPVWIEREQALYFVDIKKNRIHRYDPATQTGGTWAVPGPPGFVVPCRSGAFIVGIKDALHAWDHVSGGLTELAALADLPPGDRINDGTVDHEGRLWFGTLNEGNSAATGKLYRYDGGETILTCDSGYIVSNGPAIAPDGRTLYHANSLEGVVYAFDLEPDGTLLDKRVFVRFEPDVFPDGMAIDADGTLWIAVFNGWRIDAFSPAGEQCASIRFPCAQVTKPAFGGPDLRTLYVTTAQLGFTPQVRAEQLLAGALFAIEMATPGLPASLATDPAYLSG